MEQKLEHRTKEGRGGETSVVLIHDPALPQTVRTWGSREELSRCQAELSMFHLLGKM